MPSPIETWYTDIPPITRIYITASCLTSLAVQLGFVHPLQLWLNYDRIIHGYQWWRLVTNFLYFGPLSIDFLFHMFFLARYSRMMEEGFFRNKPADYVWLLLFSATTLIVCSTVLPFAYMPFLGSPLAFTMVYIWARRNPYVRLNFLGLVVFSAPHLPWVLLAFSLLLSGQLPMGDLLGIGVGHIYYFFEDIWPRDPASGGRRLLETPRFIRWLIDSNRQDDGIELHNDSIQNNDNHVVSDEENDDDDDEVDENGITREMEEVEERTSDNDDITFESATTAISSSSS